MRKNKSIEIFLGDHKNELEEKKQENSNFISFLKGGFCYVNLFRMIDFHIIPSIRRKVNEFHTMSG